MGLAVFDDALPVGGFDVGVDVFVEVAHGNDGVAFVFEVLHELFEVFLNGVHPGVVDIGYTVELEDGDFIVFGDLKGFEEIFHVPEGACVACGGDEEGVVEAGDVAHACAEFVVVFGFTTAPGELDPVVAEDLEGFGGEGIARPGEGDGFGDAVFFALLFDVIELVFEAGDGVVGDAHVVFGVVADFEAGLVEFGDLFPGHVGFGFLLAEAVGDVEGGAESVFFENGFDDGVVGFDGIIEGEDGEFIGDGEAVCCGFVGRGGGGLGGCELGGEQDEEDDGRGSGGHGCTPWSLGELL